MTVVVTGVGTALAGVDTPAGLLAPRRPDAEPADPKLRLGKRGLRYNDRATQLGMALAHQALQEAGLLGEEGLTVPGECVAVVVGSNFGNVDTVDRVIGTIAEESGTRGLSPMDLPNASSNVIASAVALRFGLKGPNLMVCNGPTSGLDAVHWAATLVASGRARYALAVGVEPDNPAVRRLIRTGRPVDGGAAVVIEAADTAAGRGATVHAGLGPYVRTGGVRQCVARLDAAGLPAPALLQVPESDGAAVAEDVLAGVERLDLGAVWGRSSAALGLLQCAAAIGRFAAGGDGPVYALAGNDGDDATAGLVLMSPGALR